MTMAGRISMIAALASAPAYAQFVCPRCPPPLACALGAREACNTMDDDCDGLVNNGANCRHRDEFATFIWHKSYVVRAGETAVWETTMCNHFRP